MSVPVSYTHLDVYKRQDEQGHGSANDMGMDVIALQDLPQYTV